MFRVWKNWYPGKLEFRLGGYIWIMVPVHKGSWDLVTRLIILTKSHDPPSAPARSRL